MSGLAGFVQISLITFMSNMINNLGTKLFKSVTDKAGDLGEKFEEEFSRLSWNITAEVDAIVVEAISLSEYIKVALVILSILMIMAIIRFTAYAIRWWFWRRRTWFRGENLGPQMVLMVPIEDGMSFEKGNIYADPRTRGILNRLRAAESVELLDVKHPRPLVPPKIAMIPPVYPELV